MALRGLRRLATEVDEQHHESMKTLEDDLGELHFGGGDVLSDSRRRFSKRMATGGAIAFGATMIPIATMVPSAMAQTSGTTPGAIDIKDYSFTPAAATAKVGDKVTWTNHDDNAHYVKSDSPDTTLDSGTMDPGGQPYAVTFTKAGTYAYHCNIHNTMKGTVVVS